MRAVAIECSNEELRWLSEIDPQISESTSFPSPPLSGTPKMIELIIVGCAHSNPVQLGHTFSEWTSAPVTIFLLSTDEYQEKSLQLSHSPGIGKNVLFCESRKGAFSETIEQAKQALSARAKLTKIPSDAPLPIGPNVSARSLLFRLLSELPEYIYFKDREGRFLAVSKYLADSTGLSSPEEAIGKTDYDLFDPEHAHDADSDERSLAEGLLTYLEKEEYVTWNDNRIWVYSYKRPLLSPSGFVLGTYGISRDITQTKRLQEDEKARHKQLSDEMELARSLQKSLLQQAFPIFSNPDGSRKVRFAVKHVASTKLSGDFYSITLTPNGQAVIFLADVMGHGASAAMITAMLYAAVKELEGTCESPEDFMLEINNRLHAWLEGTEQIVFATGICCVLDFENKVAKVCQNGSNHFFRIREGYVVSEQENPFPINPALGLTPQTQFETFSFPLEEEETIAFFTDGILEARNQNEEPFGQKRLSEFLIEDASTNLYEKLDSLHKSLQNFTRRSQEEDDLCVLIAKIGA
ncbi:SpoIIE family protein phosphatase [Pelagicoccus albus]|uniref:SpoIIE family protein phosphatase n=1 Tax=Pelagicoccus albus TaxID=415222 RepID=A0A7X1B5P1_9BACT|nr:SpoIIE family protein phosphatase [Pelagicoccus albus]MBC2606100.1 SpoIIE family protein phosphatase [Pelagicoccus albus]